MIFFVKSDHARAKSVFVTTSWPWHPHYIAAGQYDWRKHSVEFSPGGSDSVELRFVVEDHALLWIDDIAITALSAVGTDRHERGADEGRGQALHGDFVMGAG